VTDPVRACEVLGRAAELGADTLVARALTGGGAGGTGRAAAAGFGSGETWGWAHLQSNGLAVHHDNAQPRRAYLVPRQTLDQIAAQVPQGLDRLAVALDRLDAHSRTYRQLTLPVHLQHGRCDPAMSPGELRAAQLGEYERWREQVSRPWRARDDELRAELRRVLDEVLRSPQGFFDFDGSLAPLVEAATCSPTHLRLAHQMRTPTGPQM